MPAQRRSVNSDLGGPDSKSGVVPAQTRVQARQAVSVAVRGGTLKKQPCMICGKLAASDTYSLCVPCGRPYRDGDEIWGKNLGYKPGDTFIYDRERYIVVEPGPYLLGKERAARIEKHG